MKYSPSARDGVFVVEVQQGVRRSPGSGGNSGPITTSTAATATATTALTKDAEASVSISNQCALIHNPPERFVY